MTEGAWGTTGEGRSQTLDESRACCVEARQATRRRTDLMVFGEVSRLDNTPRHRAEPVAQACDGLTRRLEGRQLLAFRGSGRIVEEEHDLLCRIVGQSVLQKRLQDDAMFLPVCRNE